MDLRLRRHELQRLKILAARELRSPGQYVTALVIKHLEGRRKLGRVQLTPPFDRSVYSVKLRLSPEQRDRLRQRADAEGRSVANYVTALVARRMESASIRRR